jgi:hypothetical protein
VCNAVPGPGLDLKFRSMATDLIRYDLLVQDAFREIFRRVLTDVAEKGLPGEHHFLVTFRTGAPGVKISERLLQAHPQDMTIVLQHQFWDLTVTDTGFSVGLSFKNVAEKLVVPFSAVTGFFDPSVNFGAEFTPELKGNDGIGASPEMPRSTPKPLAVAAKPRTRGSASEPTEMRGEDASDNAGTSDKPMLAPQKVKLSEERPAKEAEPAAPPSSEPKVVSIDAFRKKT